MQFSADQLKPSVACKMNCKQCEFEYFVNQTGFLINTKKYFFDVQPNSKVAIYRDKIKGAIK